MIQTNQTILNTTAETEIILPGFLKMNYEQDLRIEKQISKGGAGIISAGMIVNTDIKMKLGRAANNTVVIKLVSDDPNLSDEENLTKFHQEVAIMNSLLFHPNSVLLLG